MKGHGTNFHRVYATQAETYDAFSRAERFDPSLAKALNGLLRGDALLDVAAGTGEKTRRYAKRFGIAVAFDRSPTLLALGNARHRTKNMTFVVGTAASLPFPDAAFDCVLTTWGSFPMTKAIPEMQRVLAPGGRIIRIGTVALDSLTSLFPKFSLHRVRSVNRSYRKRGFTETSHTVHISFRSLHEARAVLSAICGCAPERITSATLVHHVVLHIYQSPNRPKPLRT